MRWRRGKSVLNFVLQIFTFAHIKTNVHLICRYIGFSFYNFEGLFYIFFPLGLNIYRPNVFEFTKSRIWLDYSLLIQIHEWDEILQPTHFKWNSGTLVGLHDKYNIQNPVQKFKIFVCKKVLVLYALKSLIK